MVQVRGNGTGTRYARTGDSTLVPDLEGLSQDGKLVLLQMVNMVWILEV